MKDRQLVADWTFSLPAESQAARKARLTLVDLWAGLAPREAAEWALSTAEGEGSASVLAVASAWARLHPNEALAWTLSLSNTSLRWEAASHAFASWIEHPEFDAEPAIHWLRPLSEEVWASGMFQALSEVIEPQPCLEWAVSLEMGTNRQIVLENALYNLGKTAPREAARHLDRLSVGEVEGAVESLCLGWLVGGGRQSLKEWRAELPEQSRYVSPSFKAEITLTAALDPRRARRVLDQAPSPELRDDLFVYLIERCGRRVPEDAGTWIEEIDDPAKRRLARQHLEAARSSAFTAILPDSSKRPFSKQTLAQLHQYIDYVLQRP